MISHSIRKQGKDKIGNFVSKSWWVAAITNVFLPAMLPILVEVLRSKMGKESGQMTIEGVVDPGALTASVSASKSRSWWLGETTQAKSSEWWNETVTEDQESLRTGMKGLMQLVEEHARRTAKAAAGEAN